MNHSAKSLLVFSIAATFLGACASNEIGDSKDVAQDKIYQAYDINYTEGDTAAEVYCQFRFAGKNGTTLVLNNPSHVELDGEKIKADSSGGSGAFYRIYKPASTFMGAHQLSFTTTNNQKLENSFHMSSFKLTAIPASVSKKQNLVLHFDGPKLQGDDYIELSSVNTDSSFSITSEAGNNPNSITIPAKELKRQKGNELQLEATVYQTAPLQQNTAEGGRLRITYQLKRFTIQLAH